MAATFTKNRDVKFHSWIDFKPYIDGYYGSLYYFWSYKNAATYTIITELQGGHHYEVDILIDGGPDQLDFEANFKDKPPRQPGSNTQASAKPVAMKQLYDIQSLVIYIGSAPQGALTSEPVWIIKKVILDASGAPISTEWSSDSAIWNNRSIEIYS
jgi:hypothetical protein